MLYVAVSLPFVAVVILPRLLYVNVLPAYESVLPAASYLYVRNRPRDRTHPIAGRGVRVRTRRAAGIAQAVAVGVVRPSLNRGGLAGRIQQIEVFVAIAARRRTSAGIGDAGDADASS